MPRRTSRRPRRSRPSGAMDTAIKALVVANGIKRLMNVEIKHLDVNPAPLSAAQSGTVVNLSKVVQGDGQSQRDGSSLKPLMLKLKGIITNPGTNTDSNIVRVMVFRGKQENGIDYTVGDILATADVLSFKHYDNRFRSKMLFDRTFKLNLNGGVANADGNKIFFEKNIKLTGHITYDDNTTDIENGGVYLLLISDATSTVPTVDYSTRLTYTDN